MSCGGNLEEVEKYLQEDVGADARSQLKSRRDVASILHLPLAPFHPFVSLTTFTVYCKPRINAYLPVIP